jgi:hypothetical protein
VFLPLPLPGSCSRSICGRPPLSSQGNSTRDTQLSSEILWEPIAKCCDAYQIFELRLSTNWTERCNQSSNAED